MPAIITTCAPESTPESVDEVVAVFGRTPVTSIGEGLLRFQVDDATAAATRLASSRPVFIRHQVPATTALGGPEAGSVENIAAMAGKLVATAASSGPVGVQIRMVNGAGDGLSRKLLWEAIRTSLEGHVPLDSRHPAWVLSVIVGATVDFGFNPVELNLSAWAGGARHFAHLGDDVSRAEYKLVEAIEVFGLMVVAGERAVDLGAAPGGWTRHLAERGLTVTAVDPAALDARVLRMPGVRHQRVWADVFAAREAPGSIDLLVNDMRMDAGEAASLLVAMRPLLSVRGRVITTLKLPRHGRVNAMRSALSILEPAYNILQVKQLFHNRSEVTALLSPRVSN